jgi:hypothetical protein
MTFRPTTHNDYINQQTPQQCENLASKGGDSYCNPLVTVRRGSGGDGAAVPNILNNAKGGEMKNYRLSRKQLEQLNTKLSDRDKEVLGSVEMCRYILSSQIKRLHFTEHASPSACTRTCNLALEKLCGYRLVEILPRRIGGIGHGSGAHTFLLTEAGARLLHLDDNGYTPRKRFFEPSTTFLTHTLAVAEIYVKTNEVCKQHGLTLSTVELEPACWRGYRGEDGKPATLKPDMYAVTVGGQYEDYWFLEVDLGTESPSVVLDKCRRYNSYYLQQQAEDVFPLVVWIVNKPERKASLMRHILECDELPYKNLFLVIIPDELETLLVSGADALGSEKGVQS